MNTIESDQIIKEYLKQQEIAEQLQRLKLKKNLETFTLKELRKEVIAMKADKLAVTKMTRENIINLILQFHWLFPHLMTKTGTKRNPTEVAKRLRRPLNNPRKQPKQVKTGIPPGSIKITPELLKMLEQPAFRPELRALIERLITN